MSEHPLLHSTFYHSHSSRVTTALVPAELTMKSLFFVGNLQHNDSVICRISFSHWKGKLEFRWPVTQHKQNYESGFKTVLRQ